MYKYLLYNFCVFFLFSCSKPEEKPRVVTINGLVKESDETPVPFAKVYFYSRNYIYNSDKKFLLDTVICDVDGKFSWTSVINPSDDFYTHAEKLNYEKSDYISIRKNSDYTFVIKPLTQITVRVINDTKQYDGIFISNNRITILNSETHKYVWWGKDLDTIVKLNLPTNKLTSFNYHLFTENSNTSIGKTYFNVLAKKDSTSYYELRF